MRISHNTLCRAKFSHNLEQLASKGYIFLISIQIVHGLKRWILDCQSFEMVYKIALFGSNQYLSVSDIAMGCMLAQLDDLGKERAIYYLNHLASLPVSDDRPIDDDFPDEQFVSVTSIAGWQLYFNGAANQSRFGIGILLISPQGDHIPILVRLAFFDHHRLTNNVVEYEACITSLETELNLGVIQLEIHGDSNLVIQQTQGIWRT
ncbi:hypothetical protein CK203_104556 [Vitis vinifera]|uniref:RNase H type-1 domain-containing protein n=1 Tax=Vitis vinifera TaxID=29760 RepID=A0A438FGJ6_VITVI|nr:hypothetical protein CK203_104556 [Vitis vinifera]